MIPNNNSQWRDLFSGRNGAISFALSFGVIIHAVNILMATTILPSVVNDIGGISLYAWNTTLFVAASIIGSVLSARLLSSLGARSAYLIATLLFFIGSLLCAIAPVMETMLIGRFVQGLGGGILFALAYAMVNIVYDQALWPRAMALISGMWGVATLVGPAVGGIFAQLDAWRYAFGIMLPVMIFYGIYLWFILPKNKETARKNTKKPLPYLQLIILTITVLLISSGSLSSSLTINLLSIVAVFALIAVLIFFEKRLSVRLLPANTFKGFSLHALLYITISLLAIGMTCEVFVPYYLQSLHGQTPLASGYMSALMALGWTVAEVMSASWQGAKMRFSIFSGPIIVFVGLLVLAWAIPNPMLQTDNAMMLTIILFGLFFIGYGIGFGWPHLLTRILQAAAEEDKDIAGASITTVQLFATALGSAFAGMIVNLNGFNSGTAEGLSSSASALFLFLALAPLVAIYTAWKITRRSY
ncbi:multidrug resistance protein B [Proteus hauseri ATCC 700826]|uniref:Multidrug resistance protein B n=1 Tax=Proteus hauseri ATCC 700826 TaxID=1354271 RepID=A0AAJ3HS35_PROHU|nr:MFS transporter [Proteus hauseri]OAT46500.1 multidrug resistance protein B [Proteus hauseri ATCC 700826]